MNDTFVELLQFVAVTYVALAAEPNYAFAAAQAALQLARSIVEYIKR